MPDPLALSEDNCTCGHVLDEHDDELACTVEGCPCFHYEHDGILLTEGD